MHQISAQATSTTTAITSQSGADGFGLAIDVGLMKRPLSSRASIGVLRLAFGEKTVGQVALITIDDRDSAGRCAQHLLEGHDRLTFLVQKLIAFPVRLCSDRAMSKADIDRIVRANDGDLARRVFEFRHGGMANGLWPQIADEVKDHWYAVSAELVRAVLQAIHEPSDELQASVWKPRDGFSMHEYDLEAWKAMIDKLLED